MDLLNCLDYRERQVVELRYGLTDGYLHEPDEVARTFGMQTDDAKAIESLALIKLREKNVPEKLQNEGFGYISGEAAPYLNDSSPREGFQAVMKVINSLEYRPKEIVKLRYGFEQGFVFTLEEVGRIFNISASEVSQIERQAISDLQEEHRLAALKEYLQEFEDAQHTSQLLETVSEVRRLTPQLIKHLQENTDDIVNLRWEVFEELVAEVFAQWGFEEVRLVGRDSRTSADILAVQKQEGPGVRLKYFVEVKRTQERIGVGVIDRVLGAVLNERMNWGWHLGMIVSTAGYRDYEKYTREELELRGLHLRDKDDVVQWLQDYTPSDKGLWLPPDFRVSQT